MTRSVRPLWEARSPGCLRCQRQPRDSLQLAHHLHSCRRRAGHVTSWKPTWRWTRRPMCAAWPHAPPLPPQAPLLEETPRIRRADALVARHAPWLLRPLLWLFGNPDRDRGRFFERMCAQCAHSPGCGDTAASLRASLAVARCTARTQRLTFLR